MLSPFLGLWWIRVGVPKQEARCHRTFAALSYPPKVKTALLSIPGGHVLRAVGPCRCIDTKRVRTLYQRILNRCGIVEVGLGDFYFSASLFEGLLEGFSFFLAYAFLQLAGSAVNHILGFLQTETTSLLNGLHDLELSGTCALEDYVERGLLLSGGSSASGGSSNSNSCSGGFNSLLVLEDRCQLVYFYHCQIYQFFSDSFDICHCSNYLFLFLFG